MAFTLESAVAASTAFTILIQSLGMSFPLARKFRSAAEIVAETNARSQKKERFYAREEFWQINDSLPYLETSPQRMVELVSLTHDLLLLLPGSEE